MKNKSKSSSKSAQVEKEVQKVFKRRSEILQGFGLSIKVPKQPHYILSTKK